MTKFSVIRAILDAATSDGGRLEDAVKILDEFGEREALNFTNYTEFCMTPQMWLKENGEPKTFSEVYEEYKKHSTIE
jgi:hypothetical protein